MRSLIILLFIIALMLSPEVKSTQSVRLLYIYKTANIVDHSDPSVKGSIAWYFDKYKSGTNVFYLMTPENFGSYDITRPLILPKDSTLQSFYGNSLIRAVGKIKSMLRVSSSSNVSSITFDGNYKAGNIIQGSRLKDFQLSNSVIRGTVNVYDDGVVVGHDDREARYVDGRGRVSAHGVVLSSAENIFIMDNLITNIGDIGWDVSNNSGPTPGTGIVANGLSLRDGKNLTVTRNEIRFTLTGGVDISGARNATITHNTIDNTARNRLYGEYGDGLSADGIVGYHHAKLPPNENLHYVITDNIITNWYNHGIHVGGRHINISRNHISLPGIRTPGSAIFIGDFRERTACSSIIWIQNNYVEKSANSQSKGIRARNYKHIAYWPSGNTGDVGNGINIIDHRYANLPTVKFDKYPGSVFKQKSCPIGYADDLYRIQEAL